MDNMQYTEQNAENIRKLFMQKTASKSEIGMRVVFIAAAFTVFATFAIVAGMYLNSFERLQAIIGDEQAVGLQPVGTIIEGGFRMELVAVGVLANTVDLYITLEDLVCNRLDDDILVIADLWVAGDPLRRSLPQFSRVIDQANSGVVTLHTRMSFLNSIEGRMLDFQLYRILYNFRTAEHEIDFDLSAAAEQTPIAWLWDTPILPPHLHNIPVALDGFENVGEISISSIGLIGGRLHIQEQYDMTALHQWVGNKVNLINPQGDIVQPLRGAEYNTASVSFRIDGYDNFYNDRGYNFVVDFPYRENIFEVDIDRLAEYRLAVRFNANDSINLRWRVRFEIDIPPEGMELLVVDELSIQLGSTTITEVRVSPFNVIVLGFGSQGLEQPQVRVHTADGIIDISRGWISIDTLEALNFVETMEVEGAPIRLDDVIAVEINGHMIII